MDQSITDTPVSNRSPQQGIVFLDFDDALIRDSSWRLLHDQFDVVEEADMHYDQFGAGKIDFAEWGNLDAGLWEGYPESGIVEAAASVNRLCGINNTIAALSDRGYRVGIVSGGVEQLIQEVLTDVSLDFLVANDLEIEGGVITGDVNMRVTSAGKPAIFRQLATQYDVPLDQTVAVGNSADDFQPDGQGLQIGLNPSDDTARDRSDVVIEGDSLEPVVGVVHDWDRGS